MTDERLAEIEKYIADEMDPVYPDAELADAATELIAEVRRLRAEIADMRREARGSAIERDLRD